MPLRRPLLCHRKGPRRSGAGHRDRDDRHETPEAASVPPTPSQPGILASHPTTGALAPGEGVDLEVVPKQDAARQLSIPALNSWCRENLPLWCSIMVPKSSGHPGQTKCGTRLGVRRPASSGLSRRVSLALALSPAQRPLRYVREGVTESASGVVRAVATRSRIALDRRSALQARHTSVGGTSTTGIAMTSGGI